MIVSIEDEAAEAAEVANLMARQNSQAAASANVAAAAAVRNGYGYEVIWVVVFSREGYKITIKLWKIEKKKNEKNPINCSKISKKSLFFPLFGKKSFLNQT